jgi:glycosyltransferase involved in cell wall biosynthesis
LPATREIPGDRPAVKASRERFGSSPTCLRILTNDSFQDYEILSRSLGIRDRIDVRPVRLEDLPEELSAATVAVNPRIACDGLPQKLLNYMAAGCPIVSFAGSAL